MHLLGIEREDVADPADDILQLGVLRRGRLEVFKRVLLDDGELRVFLVPQTLQIGQRAE
jgi:hypothetical protein